MKRARANASDRARAAWGGFRAWKLCWALLLIAVIPPVWAQEPQTFRGGTTLIPVDVRVLEAAGNPVTDLQQTDFTVLENGVAQPIRHFSAQAFTPQPPGPRDALKTRTAGSNDIATQNRRIFLIVLGRGRLQPPSKGVDGMMHFVRDRLLPQDLVAVMAWNRATEFTTNREEISALLERFKKAHEKIESLVNQRFSGLAAIYGSREIPANLQSEIDAVFGGPSAKLSVRSTQPTEGSNATRVSQDRRETLDQLMQDAIVDQTGDAGVTLDEYLAADTQTMQDVGKLYAGIEYLRHFEGEKHLVFVSERGLSLPRSEDDRDVGSLAADARVAIDYIHTGGTPGPGLFMAASRGGGPMGGGRGAGGGGGGMGRAAGPPLAQMAWSMATARTFADLSGGRFFGTRNKDAATDMDFVDAATRFGYTLGYYPANALLDRKYRRITVRVNRPGLTLLYRHGYFASPPRAPLDRQQILTYSRIAAAANYANAVPDIGVKAKVEATKPPAAPQVTVSITIDPKRLGFAKTVNRSSATLDLAIFCVNDRDVLVGQAWRKVELLYSDDRLAVAMRDGIPVEIPVGLTAPAKNVKVVLYDFAADLVGSAIVKVN